MNLKKQLSVFYFSSFCASLRLSDAVWVALLAARGFSLWEIGLAEGIFHTVSLLCEVPSGMMADLLGRKRTLVCSRVMRVLSGLTMAFAFRFSAVCLGMALSALAGTMGSGTSEALVYDSLKQCGKEPEYLQTDADIAQISRLASGLGAVSSILTHWLDSTQFYLVSALPEALSAAANTCLKEPVVTEIQAARQALGLKALRQRFSQLAKESVRCLRATPRAVRIILADAVICLPAYLTTMFLQQRLVELGWPTAWLFVPSLLSGLAAAAGTELGRRLHPRSLRRLYVLCAPMCGAGCILVGAASVWGSIAGAMLVQSTLEVWLLHAMQQLNDAIPSDQRATLISVDSMAYSLLMIPVSPLVGWLGDLTGHAGAGLCALGFAVAASGFAVRSSRSKAQ
ncbi:MAG: MFS transporter [Faecalibacterium sp.]